jgi:feruloyl-CoA synthase
MVSAMSRLQPQNSSASSTRPLRPLAFGAKGISVDKRPDGTIYIANTTSLPPAFERVSDALLHWAHEAPDRIFLAERDKQGEWRKVTYGQALHKVRALASAFLARGLSPERPVLVLSGNSIDHALLMLAGYYSGAPICPLTVAYSLISKDHSKLKHALSLLTPGLVFADDGDAFSTAINAAVPEDTEVMISRGAVKGRATTHFSDALATPLAANLEAVRSSLTPDSIAKFLLTSGSTGVPKAVINTHRMICLNQVQIRETMTFLKEEPPVIIDWLPWNHTFGSNKNFGLILINGGSLYIDAGKPTPDGLAETVKNLREIAPTIYFNVPKGFEMLVPVLREDAALREVFFSRLKCMFFAGASLSAHVWNELDEISLEYTGHIVPMLTGLGATETAPYAFNVLPETSRSGHIGLPAPGVEVKLVPNAGKLECRVRGPSITPGYWRMPDMTEKAFDDEGYYMLGDAIKPADPDDFSQGFDFDGRVSEDFKLASGTWVSVGPMRAKFIAACAPLLRDVVLAGINRDDLAAIGIPDADGCRSVVPHLPASASLDTVINDPVFMKTFRAKVKAFLATATGSSTRIPVATIFAGSLSIDKGEVTDKGSVNQRSFLEHHADLVEKLYADNPPSPIVTVHQPD